MKTALLSVAATEAIATVVRGRHILPCQRFDNEPHGWQAFGLWLRSNRVPIAIIVDAVEEDYRSEILPHTRGDTRKQLLERKIRQHYRNTPYTTSIRQGRESGGRRDDRYLFAALTNPDFLEPWLNEIEREQTAVSGVYLTPLVSAPLVNLLGIAGQPVLLVSQRRTGLRQSFFDHGELKLSRLTSIDASQPRAGYAKEIFKTRAYLTSLRLIARDAQLKVVLLDSDGSLGELVRTLGEDLAIVPERVGPGALAKLARSGPANLAACPEALPFLIFARSHPIGSLAPEKLLRRFRVFRARRLIFGLAATIFLASAIVALVQLRERAAVNTATASLANAIRQQQTLYAVAARGFPSSPAPADVLQNAVQLGQLIQNEMRTPARALEIAAAALERNPHIFVKKLSWDAGRATNEKKMQTSEAAPAQLGETLEIEGEIRPFDGDFRIVLAKVEQFATDLSNDARTAQARIIESPLNLSSQANLSGSAAAERANPGAATFRLRLELKAR